MPFLTIPASLPRPVVPFETDRGTMQTLTIHAASRESAIGIYAALEGFRTQLTEREDGCRVEIELVGGEREIIEALSAIAQHVRDRDDGLARLELSGRT